MNTPEVGRKRKGDPESSEKQPRDKLQKSEGNGKTEGKGKAVKSELDQCIGMLAKTRSKYHGALGRVGQHINQIETSSEYSWANVESLKGPLEVARKKLDDAGHANSKRQLFLATEDSKELKRQCQQEELENCVEMKSLVKDLAEAIAEALKQCKILSKMQAARS